MKKLFIFLFLTFSTILSFFEKTKADYIQLDSLWQMNFDTTTVLIAKFSPDGRYIALSQYLDSDHKADSVILKPMLINRATGQVVREFTGLNSSRVYTLDFSPDGTLLVGGGTPNDDSLKVCVWNVSTGNLVRTLLVNDSNLIVYQIVKQVIFSPNGNKLFVRILGTEHIDVPPYTRTVQMLVVIDTQTWQTERYVKNINFNVIISPDNRYYAPIFLGQRSVDLYDFNNDTLVHTFVQKGDSSYTISTFDFSPDSNNIAISDVYDIRIYNMNNYAQVDSISFLDSIHPPHQIMPIKYFPNSRYICLNNLSGLPNAYLMKIYDFQTRQFIYQDSSSQDVDITKDSLFLLRIEQQKIILDSIIYVQYKRVVDNEDGANKFNISPNPVFDILILNNPPPDLEMKNIEIFSALGVKLIETEYKERIDVSVLAPGVYFVKIGDKVEKFVKI